MDACGERQGRVRGHSASQQRCAAAAVVSAWHTCSPHSLCPPAREFIDAQPGGAVQQPVPGAYSVMVHVNKGAGRFGPGLAHAARAEQAVLFERAEGEGQGLTLVEFSCPPGAAEPLDVLLLAGQPTDETIVQYGPFVGGSMVSAGLLGRSMATMAC